jgi:membrane-associated phospholipid phosphatase
MRRARRCGFVPRSAAAGRGIALVAALAAVWPSVARAQDASDPGPPPLATSAAVDGAVIVTALALAGASSLVHVDTKRRWDHELLPIDDPVKRNFSAGAARASDLLLTLAVLTPLAADAGRGLDGGMGQRTLVYGETLAISLALNAGAKYLVGRPRPYVYNADPLVAEYARGQERDSRLSFYSGHAATSFAAAVAGAYLFSQSSADTTTRTVVWATGLALAGATSNLRVRGGKHFYSDVIIGSVVGAGVGLAVPMLHMRGQPGARSLATSEWIAIAAAPIAGALVSQLIPMPADVTLPLESKTSTTQVLPWLSGNGGGVMFARQF